MVIAASLAALLPGAAHAMPQGPASALPWDPTEGAPRDAHYAGQQVCAQCHVSEATQRDTPMGQAAEAPGACDALIHHPLLTYRQGSYFYRIARDGKGFAYSLTDGLETVSVPILWVFGKGEAGQTYVFERNGAYYQSRVSFFNNTQKLDVTLGFERKPPTSFDAALGERMDGDQARLCITCHNTGANSGVHLHIDTMALGVNCESCHGPGGDHAAGIKNASTQRAAIFNPGKLDPGALNEFCGSCHRTWWQVKVMQIHDVTNVRFQPYRLENSRCWNPRDARISCLACHNPHQARHRDTSFYDPKCLSCHPPGGGLASAKSPGRACPVGNRNCINCHMPKYELPGGHFKFTDHYIRIKRARETYPG